MIETFYPGREFSAYLFDFDGTIADTMPPHLDAWNKALGLYGLTLSRDQHMAWAGRPTREIVKLLNELHDLEMSVEDISKAKEIHYMSSIPLVKGIVPVVDIIRAAHGKIPMAVVSGSRRKPVEATLDHLEMRSLFDVLVCAEDYTIGKPAPDCFLKAASLLGVRPEDCLVFEDAALGIEAAHNAGMACLQVGDSSAGHPLSIAKSHRRD